MDYMIKLEEKELNVVLMALQERPFKDVNLLVNKIIEQGNEQIEAVKKPAEEPVVK